jgi:hypothetical protein
VVTLATLPPINHPLQYFISWAISSWRAILQVAS